MTWRAVVWTVLAVAGVGGLVGGLGWDERRREGAEIDALLRGEAPPERDPGWLERALVGEATPTTSYTVAVSFNPETGDWHTGERSWRGEPMAKTQVAQYITLECTVQINGILPAQTIHPLTVTAPVMFTPSGTTVIDGVTNYMFDVGDPGGDAYWGTAYVPADGELHDFAVTIEYPATLTTERADDPIGDKTGATHAKERAATDAWVVAEEDDYRITIFGETKTQPGSGTPSNPMFGFSAIVDVDSTQGHYYGEMDYCRCANILWNGAAIDCSRCNLEFLPTYTGGSDTPENVWLRGDGNMIRCMQDDYVGTSSTPVTCWAGRPIVHSFSGLHVTDMDNVDLADLVLWFTGAQWYNANLAAWEYRGYTLAEWQALTLIPDWGLYSWDATPPPDGALRTLATAAFYIDRDSAREHGLDGFAETA